MGKKPLKVMFVDDDKFQVLTVTAWLKSAGYEVISRDSPFGTSRDVLREQPDILLLDINMPGLDGSALAGATRKQMGRAGIIFYSGQEREAMEGLVRQHEALGAIQKTHDGKAFLAEFNRLVQGR